MKYLKPIFYVVTVIGLYSNFADTAVVLVSLLFIYLTLRFFI